MLHRGRNFPTPKENCKQWKIFGKPRKSLYKSKQKIINHKNIWYTEEETYQTQEENCKPWKIFGKPRKILSKLKKKFETMENIW